MCRIKSAWWVLAIFLSTLFLPTGVFARRADPHVYRVIQGSVVLSYSRATTSQNGETTNTTSRYSERYSFLTLGNILSPGFFVYDAGGSLVKTTNISENKNKIKGTGFFLETGILPRSRYQTTTYFRRDKTETNKTEGAQNDNYGLTTKIRPRVLPTTTIRADKSVSKPLKAGATSTNDHLSVAMKKDMGPVKNDFAYTLNRSERSDLDAKQRTSVLSFSNRTNVSRSTDFGLAATRSTSKTGTAPDTTINAMGAQFSSKPGSGFEHSHNYTFFSSKSPNSNSDGNFYSGAMNYQVSNRLSSAASIYTNQTKTESATSQAKIEDLNSEASVLYRLTSRHRVSEKIYYTRRKSDNTGPNPVFTDSSTLNVESAITYSRGFDFATLGAGYSAGYFESKLKNGAQGKGLSQGVSLSLSGIEVKRYARLSTAASYSTSTQFEGDTGSSSQAYRASAANTIWKKYVDIFASANKSTSSAPTQLNTGIETYLLSMNSNYFNATPLSMFMTRIKTFTSVAGVNTNDTLNARASHRRRLWNGIFGSSISYSWRHAMGRGADETESRANYRITYSRLLLRRVRWEFKLWRDEHLTGPAKRSTTNITNEANLNLRAWSFGASHTYTLAQNYGNKSATSEIFFTVSRSFMKFL